MHPGDAPRHPSTRGFKDWVETGGSGDLAGEGREGRGAPPKSADLGLGLGLRGLASAIGVTQGGPVGSPRRPPGPSWNNGWQRCWSHRVCVKFSFGDNGLSSPSQDTHTTTNNNPRTSLLCPEPGLGQNFSRLCAPEQSAPESMLSSR